MLSDHSGLPAFYAHADRGRSLCRVVGCGERIVRGITLCARHEYEYDCWPEKGMDGWRSFLVAAGGDRHALDEQRAEDS